MSITAAAAQVQTFICVNCDETFSRPISRGRPPFYCPTCRELPKSMLKPATAARIVEAETPATAEAAVERVIAGPRFHKSFSDMLTVLKAGVHVMMVGPAGSGKSKSASQAAKALGLPFWAESCHPLMTKWDLFGFVNAATGDYSPGVLREAFEFGGVVLLDEMDASNPGLLMAINNLAAVEIGDEITFPGNVNVARHPDFHLLSGTNTYGNGANGTYSGREKMDASTPDRFAVIPWTYDEELERAIVPNEFGDWVLFVQRVRAAAKASNVEMLVTPRASIMGARLLAAGLPKRKVEDMVVWKGLVENPTALRTVKSAMRVLAAQAESEASPVPASA